MPWKLPCPAPVLLPKEPYRFAPRSGVAYRAFCEECIYVSLYFYRRGGAPDASLIPLAPWRPCMVPSRRVFPSRERELAPGGPRVPLAFDADWLHRAQRPPVVWANSGEDGEGQGTCHELRRSSGLPLASIEPAFDLSAGVHAELSLFDLMRLREDSEEEGLHRFSDKFLFKTELLRQGVPVPEVFHLSRQPREPAELLLLLRELGKTRFVAKPTHLAATSFVYAMRDGINMVSGQPATLEEVAEGLAESFRDKHVDDWATESTPPGFVIEELVEPPRPPRVRPQGGTTPDELKCQTFFGELLFCEWVFVQNMTTGEDGSGKFADAHSAGDRAMPSIGHNRCGIPNFVSKGYIFRDGTCMDCPEQVPLAPHRWEELVRMVEGVATGTDHIRLPGDMKKTPSPAKQGTPMSASAL